MSRSFLTGAVVGAAVLGAALLLNPSAERHRDKIKTDRKSTRLNSSH